MRATDLRWRRYAPYMTLFAAETIEQWLSDFVARGHRMPKQIRMVERDLDVEGQEDAGLVVIELGIATTGTFLERPAHDKPNWNVHFMEREQEIVATSAEVDTIAAELTMIAQLAAYLEARTAEALARENPA